MFVEYGKKTLICAPQLTHTAARSLCDSWATCTLHYICGGMYCRLKQSVTSPAYIDSYDVSASSDVSAMKSFANEALTKMLAIDKCDVTKISPLYGAPDLQFKSLVSRVKVLSCIRVTLAYFAHEICERITCCSSWLLQIWDAGFIVQWFVWCLQLASCLINSWSLPK